MESWSAISTGTLGLLRVFSETAQQQLRMSWTQGYLPHDGDARWADLELAIFQEAKLDKEDFVDSWLCWGMLGYVFLSYSYPYRRVAGKGMFDRLNAVVRRPTHTQTALMKQMVLDGGDGHCGRYRRNCAVWVLMCLAGASERKKRDDDGRRPGLEGPVDRASETLMNRVKELLRFETLKLENIDLQWEVVRRVISQFWCPPGMVQEWEVMWKEQPANNKTNTTVIAAAYYRVYHHWHYAILPEDILIP
jgi:hypothetical protein